MRAAAAVVNVANRPIGRSVNDVGSKSLQLWPWLSVISRDLRGIIHSLNGVFLVLITGISGHNCDVYHIYRHHAYNDIEHLCLVDIYIRWFYGKEMIKIETSDAKKLKPNPIKLQGGPNHRKLADPDIRTLPAKYLHLILFLSWH